MCTDCYKEGHFRRECPGRRNWEDYCKEFKDMWEALMSVAYEDEDSEEDKGDEDSGLVSRLSKSEREKREIERKNEEEKKKLIEVIEQNGEKIEDMRKLKEIAEREVESLNKDLHEANEKVKEAMISIQKQQQLLSKDGDVSQEVLIRDNRIEELEYENKSNAKEIKGLKKLANMVEKTMKENDELKKGLEDLKHANSELADQLRVVEDSVKSTTRRLSKKRK